MLLQRLLTGVGPRALRSSYMGQRLDEPRIALRPQGSSEKGAQAPSEEPVPVRVRQAATDTGDSRAVRRCPLSLFKPASTARCPHSPWMIPYRDGILWG